MTSLGQRVSLSSVTQPSSGSHRAEGVSRVCRLIGVQATLRELTFERRIRRLRQGARTNPERFALKPLEQFAQLLRLWLGDHDAALGRFAKIDLVRRAKITHPVQVAEEIHCVVPRRR